MSARSAMTHRCTIQRDASHGTETNPWGGDPASAWATLHTELPCRFWFEAVRTVVDGTKATEVTVRKMVVPYSTDVTEDDRIVEVHDRLGRPLADGPMRIDSVGHRKGHVVLTMVDVR